MNAIRDSVFTHFQRDGSKKDWSISLAEGMLP